MLECLYECALTLHLNSRICEVMFASEVMRASGEKDIQRDI